MNEKHVRADALAKELLVRYGLHDWVIVWNNRKQTAGLCWSQRKTIELSRSYVELNSEADVRDTILHEIAHALVGSEHQHDSVWMAKAIEIGARPARYCRETLRPAGRWQAVCSRCGERQHKFRKPKPGYLYYCLCSSDSPPLTWEIFDDEPQILLRG